LLTKKVKLKELKSIKNKFFNKKEELKQYLIKWNNTRSAFSETSA